MVDLFDRAELRNRVGNNAQHLKILVEVFLEEYPRLLAALQDAVARADAHGMYMAAHTLKGAVANFSAPHAYEAAQQLEMQGRAGNLAGAAESVVTLEQALAQLGPALAAFAAAGGTP